MEKVSINNLNNFKARSYDFGVVSFCEKDVLPNRPIRMDFDMRYQPTKNKEAFLYDLRGITTESLGVSLQSVKVTKLFCSVLVVVKAVDAVSEERWVNSAKAIFEYYKGLNKE